MAPTGYSMSIFSVLGQGIAGNWSIYDKDGAAAVPFDTFFALTRKDEGKVTSHPTEPNGFFAYNKVDSPGTVGVVLGITGNSETLGRTLEALEKLKSSTDLVSIVTPEKTLLDYTLESYDYQRSADSGVDRLLVSLSLVEIRQVAQEYSNEKIPKAKQAADSNTTEAGKQSAQQADTATQDRWSKKHNNMLLGPREEKAVK